MIRWLDRLSFPIHIGATGTGILMAWYFLDMSTGDVIGVTLGMGLATFWQPVKRRYGINAGWAKLLSGLGLFVLGIYSFTLPDGVLPIKIGFVLVGG